MLFDALPGCVLYDVCPNSGLWADYGTFISFMKPVSYFSKCISNVLSTGCNFSIL